MTLLLTTLWSSVAARQTSDGWHCGDNPRERETVTVNGYIDSMGLARTLRSSQSAGMDFAMARDPEDRVATASFPGLFRMEEAPCEKVKDLDCQFGWKSRKYALMHRGLFRRLTAQEVYQAGRKKVGWNEWARYLDLGMKLQTPSSLAELRRALDSAGIRTDTSYALPGGTRWDSLARDPGFGVFFKETCSRAFVYGIRYRLTADSIRLVELSPYFRFRNPSMINDWLDGPSAIYISIKDTSDYYNMGRARDFMAGHRGADKPLGGGP